jgi:hypothetical protein
MDWMATDIPLADNPWIIMAIMGFWLMWAAIIVIWYKLTKTKGGFLPKGK